MTIGRKVHRSWIKDNGIRNSSECAVEQIEIAIQRTFSMSNFVCFRISLRFHSYSLVKIQWLLCCLGMI